MALAQLIINHTQYESKWVGGINHDHVEGTVKKHYHMAGLLVGWVYLEF